MQEYTMDIDLDAEATGNAPRISYRELLELAGQVCAVEFGTRRLLGKGPTWEAARNDAELQGFANSKFYQYRIPKSLVPQSDIQPGEGCSDAATVEQLR